MKNSKKKKKRSHPPKQVSPEDPDEARVSKTLTEAFSSISLDEAATAYKEANGDPNKAAEIIGNLNPTCSSSSGCSSSSSNGFVEASYGFRGGKCKQKKKIAAATGMVSSVLGKDYVSSISKRDSVKAKGFRKEDAEAAEQFLCSMLGDECELSMAVVRDVLCHWGYDLEKALNVLLELSASSSNQSKNGQSHDYNESTKGDSHCPLESSDKLTDRASDSTSQSSESEFQDNVWSMGYHRRNYSMVIADSEQHSSTSSKSSELGLPWKVLESLFNTPKSSEREPNTMNWRNVVHKMESLGQKFESCSSDNAEQQLTHANGDEYHVFRQTAKQHYDSMKSYYQKATTAYTNGERQYASYLSEQGRMHNKIAREADEKASQNIFRARNQSIENMITIDLHGQHVKQAMRLLKLHLLFGAYVRSVQLFKVITGCGSNGVGKSKLKQSVINLVEKEGIGWSEENRGTLLIRLDGQTDFSFLDSTSDTDY